MGRVTDRSPSPHLEPLLSAEGQALLAELRDHDPAQELTLATRLRREHPAELVSAALAQARLRQRGVAKFGAADAYRMYFTPNGVEQATRSTVAAYRAARFRAIAPTPPGPGSGPDSGTGSVQGRSGPDAGPGSGPAVSVTDLCCGIGGDAIELARAGFAVSAVDLDPLTCEIALANVRTLAPDSPPMTVTCADVREYDPERGPECGAPGPRALFIDPARRGGRGRIFDPEAYSPPLSWAIDAVRRAGLGAVKIAPGIPHELIPDDFEAEWISDGGDVKEAVLWHDGDRDRDRDRDRDQDRDRDRDQDRDPKQDRGQAQDRTEDPRNRPRDGLRNPENAVVPGTRRATLLPSAATLAGRGLPDPPVRRTGRFLYEPDGAVIRAHLVAEVAEELAGGLIDETIAYITADELRPTPYATAYEITDELPFNLKKLKALLREREVGVLTVKKRGSAVEPEELRRRMKLKGPNAATVFLTRVAGAPTMLIGRPAAVRLASGNHGGPGGS
ncbi:SAM-dependent methyltransferase [Streptomyces sp. NPDC088116]|uniref:class I SAM-dependent methyltransferase n=1 Tax=Streptomyces sp. NPDC088116 TaxID=3365825 RepID=UPI003825EEC6